LYHHIFTDCSDPPASKGAIANFTTTTYGSMVTYTCDYGFEHSIGDISMQCMEGGWVGEPMMCTPLGIIRQFKWALI